MLKVLKLHCTKLKRECVQLQNQGKKLFHCCIQWYQRKFQGFKTDIYKLYKEMLEVRAWFFSRESFRGHTWNVADLGPAVLRLKFAKLQCVTTLENPSKVFNMTRASTIFTTESGRFCPWRGWGSSMPDQRQSTPPGMTWEAELFRDRHLQWEAGCDRNSFQQLVWELDLSF